MEEAKFQINLPTHTSAHDKYLNSFNEELIMKAVRSSDVSNRDLKLLYDGTIGSDASGQKFVNFFALDGINTARTFLDHLLVRKIDDDIKAIFNDCLKRMLSAQFKEHVDYTDAARFGNKTANLKLLENEILAMRDVAVEVEVPAFFGIADEEIKLFLATAGELGNIRLYWRDFIEAQTHANDLTDEGKQALQRITKSLTQAFKNQQFTLTNELRNKSFQTFINTISSRDTDARLMVRSTGREDNRDVANAGGNQSFANIGLSSAEISHAMLGVLQSYFSEKSFQQRIAAGEDKETLLGDLFMPVLLQVMVGEKFNGPIPVSGVVFSREPFANTAGIVAINATWGHGESVVNGLYPVDSYFVTNRDIIYPVLRFKHTRLMPHSTGLLAVQNDAFHQSASSLKKADVLALKTIVLTLETKRGESVDIEFVKINNTIFLVQCRPVIEAANQPSFLSKSIVENLPASTVKFDLIVSGGGELKYISRPSEIVIASHLSEALDKYLGMNKTAREKVKIVISGQDAPFNSHEATTFRANNKTVVYTRDFTAAQEIAKSRANFVVDVQRRILAPIDNFDLASDSVQGWLEHPIPRQMTMNPEFFSKKLPGIIANHVEFSALKLPELFEIVRDHEDISKATRALEVVRARVKNLVEQALDDRATKPSSKPFNLRLKLLLQQFLAQSVEMESMLSMDRLQRLLAYNFLRAVFMQSVDVEEMVLPFSIFDNLAQQINVDKLAQELGIASGDVQAIEYAPLKKYAFNQNVEQAWGTFLQGWSQLSPIENSKFAAMIRDLNGLAILPLWLNLSFYETWQKYFETEKVVKEVLAHHEESFHLLEQSLTLRTQIRNFGWKNLEQPHNFQKTLQELQRNLIDPVVTFSTGKFDQTTVIVNAAKMSLISFLVDNFDQAIKAVSRSSDYVSDQAKAQDFAEMLERYHQLSIRLAYAFFSIEELKSLHKLFQLYSDSDERSYLLKICKLLQAAKAKTTIEDDARKQLLPTRYFNVSGAKLTSPADFDRSIGGPPSLEDIFTLIHQNLIVLISHKNTNQFKEQLALPELVQKLKNELKSSAHLNSINIGNDRLELVFNQSLARHSAEYTITYCFSSKKTTLGSKFIGQARERWDFFWSVAKWVLPKTKNLKNDREPFVDSVRNEIEIIWKIESDQDAVNAAEMALEFAKNSCIDRFEVRARVLMVEYAKKFTYKELEQICENALLQASTGTYNTSLFLKKMLDVVYKSEKINQRLEDVIVNKLEELLRQKKYSRSVELISNLLCAELEFSKTFLGNLVCMLLEYDDEYDWSSLYFEHPRYGRTSFIYFLSEVLKNKFEWIYLLDAFSKLFYLKDESGKTILHYLCDRYASKFKLEVIEMILKKLPDLRDMQGSIGNVPSKN